MQIVKKMKKCGFLIVFVAMSMILSFLIEPANGASARMWSGYYAQEDIDMIFVGSSVCQQSFVPEIFDKEMGVKSYNMGTPSQAMPQTMQAIREAVEGHEIKTVIYAMGFSSLMYEPITDAEMTFESARIRKKGGVESVISAMKYMFSDGIVANEKSVNFMFPWLYNYEELSVTTILQNVQGKMQKVEEYIHTGKYDPTDGLNKGYRNDDTNIFNYDNRWIHNSYNYYGEEFSESMLEEFQTMLSFCKQQDVDLIIVNVPHPAFDVVTCYESYAQNEKILKEYCKQYDVDYYDFSLIKLDKFALNGRCFSDYEHLNRKGAEIFSKQLCEFLKKRETGEFMSDYFYTVEEFLELQEKELEEWKRIKNEMNM